ncbi:Cad-domain-containing protein [Stipitochalara longipes BDJ]|nr:Cad-domain-containing protein [Stipitochalara longipes BDJ]
MQFGPTLGTACSTFAITNIDDLFVLATFFAEAASSRTSPLSPWKITLGQYIGFTVIVIISMVGYGLSFALPSEPIGFLGLLPILLGVWKFCELVFDEEEEEDTAKLAGLKSILKVSAITVMNGGDNIGTYIPLFSQAKGEEIAVYVVVYYILLGVWCLVAYLIMGQKHVLKLVERYMAWVIPFLYIGLGIYITVKSHAYPWAVQEIDGRFLGNPGKTIMGVVTAGTVSTVIGAMLWLKLRKRAKKTGGVEAGTALEPVTSCTSEGVADSEHVGNDVDEIRGVDDASHDNEKKQGDMVVSEV